MLEERVMCEDISVTLSFKPLLDNGLLMMLTLGDNTLTPIAAVGLLNGRVSFCMQIEDRHALLRQTVLQEYNYAYITTSAGYFVKLHFWYGPNNWQC